MERPLGKFRRWWMSPWGVTVVGTVLNLVLAAAKIVVGIVFNSQAIIVDGLHSGSDMATDLVVLAGLRISERPADQRHRYGHRRATTLATAVLSLILLGVAGAVAWSAVDRIAERRIVPVEWFWPLVMALVTVGVKEWLFRVTRVVGRRSGDSSVAANAWEHRSDAASALAAAVGLGGVGLGGPKWAFLDSVTALVLVCFLGLIALRFLYESAGELMDSAPAAAVLAGIESSVMNTPGVLSFHAVRVRRLGGKLEMDVHIQVEGTLTVHGGHEIARQVRRQVQQAFPHVVTVIVHVEPKEDEAPADKD